MKRTIVLLAAVLVTLATGTAMAADTVHANGPKVVCGNYANFKADGNNIIPFGVTTLPYRYQQSCSVQLFDLPLQINKITFSANPGSTNGLVSITAYIKMGQGDGASTFMDSNLQGNVQSVYAGTATATLNPNNGKNEITFVLQNPYVARSAALGNIWVDITVMSTAGNLNGFYFGADPSLWRVYTNLLGVPDMNGAGLLTEFTVSKVRQ